MNRLVGRRFAAALVLIAVAIGALWLGRYLSHRGLEWAANSSEVASFLLAVAAVLAAPFGKIAQWLRGPQPPTAEQITSAANRLRAALAAASDAEGAEVYEDQPMQVRFSSWADGAARQLAPDSSDPDVSAVTRNPIGDFGGVVEAFSVEPRLRRVVLGEAGAGKSVLVAELQRRLLSVSEPDIPVPVIMSVGAWRPDRQSLLDWLAERLTTDHAWLPVAHARVLVARGKVLPVLDGLDEMPRALQPVAVARINEHRVYRPLVVTSREEQYLDAIRQNREGVKDAPVVAIQPLLAANIKAYLDPAGGGPWTDVLTRMDASGPLGAVLGNPLMLWLAHEIYRDKSPSNLTDFTDRPSLENHLLDQFVPAVYERERTWRRPEDFRCTEWQAERWLAALACGNRTRRTVDQDHRADDRGSTALAWWRFSTAAGWWRVAGIAIRAVVLWNVAATLLVWVLTQRGNWRDGRYYGPLKFKDLLLGGRVGKLIWPAAEHLAQAFSNGVGREVQTDVATSFRVIHFVLSHTLLFMVVAVFLAFARAVLNLSWLPEAPRRLQIRIIPALAGGLASCSVILLMAAIGSFFLLHLPHKQIDADAFFDTRSTWVALLAISLIGLTTIPLSFIKPSDISSNLSPRESLRVDRQTDIVVTVLRRSAIGVTVWLFSGSDIALAYAIFAVSATIVALTLGGAGQYASRTYVDARIWLAVRGRLPWRTMSFLADAGRRGVLLQVGATYQFRHARLQEQACNWRSAPKRRLVDQWNTGKARLHEISESIGHRTGVNPPSWTTLNELCEEAARLRRVAKTSPCELPDRFRDKLAGLADRLLLLELSEGALAARILLDTYRTLVVADQVSFKPGLARSMASLAGLFPRYEALQLRRQAVDDYRELAADDPTAFLPGLADAVHGLADQLTQLGQAEEGFRAVRDLADTCGALARSSPAIFLPALAGVLDDLADRIWESEPEESLAVRREVVDIYCGLSDKDLARYGFRLTLALDSLSSSYRKLGNQAAELAAVRKAIDAQLRLAELVVVVRNEIGGQTVSRVTPLWDLAVAQNPELIPLLIHGAHDLAIELDIAGSRREALDLVDEIQNIRLLYTLRRRGEPMAPMQGTAQEESTADRLAALALRLWKLGEPYEAHAAAEFIRELVPAGRVGARAPVHRWLTRLIVRIWRALGGKRQSDETRFWRRIARQDRAYRHPMEFKDAGRIGLFGASQQLCAERLEWLSDRLDTLAFRRQVTERNAEALTAVRRAVNVQRLAVRIYRHMCLSFNAESDLAKSLDTLALRLEAAGQAEAAVDAAAEAGKMRGRPRAG